MQMEEKDGTSILSVVPGGQTYSGEMSFGEKAICRQILGPMPALPYPTKPTLCADGLTQQEYIIPDADRQEVFSQLCFFTPRPSLDDIFFDLHESKEFTVRDFRVIRWQDTNIIASPYFDRSGGMLVDWMPPNNGNSGCQLWQVAPEYMPNLQNWV